jgi:hypothetical protein
VVDLGWCRPESYCISSRCGHRNGSVACFTRNFLVIYLFSNLYDSDNRDIYRLPPASLGGEADTACSGMASGASEREARSFSGRGFGLGTVDGQSVRACSGMASGASEREARSFSGRGFGLGTVDGQSVRPLRFPPALGIPLRRNSQVGTQRLRGKYEGYIYLGVLQREGSLLPLLFENREGTGSW